MTKQTLGQRIAEGRRGRGMTQEALAEQLSVTPQAVSKWENDASCPDVMLLPQLARALDTTVDELLTGESLPRVRLAEPGERKPLSHLVLRLVLVCPNGDVMQFNQPMALVKRDMEERDDAGIFRMMNRDNEERIFDMRQVLQLIDGGVVGQLLQVDTRDGTHMELWVD